MKRLFGIIAVSLAIIAVFGMFSISASAASIDTFEVTEIRGRIGIILEDSQALCLQRTVTRPVKGTQYVRVANPEISFDLASLKKIAIAAEISGNNGDEHTIGYQSATWTVTDNADTNQAKLFGGPSAKALADGYVETAQNINLDDYVVDVEFYESVTGEYQMLATFKVTEKVTESTKLPDPEIEVDEESEPEPQKKEEPKPEIKDEEKPKPEPEKEETPKIEVKEDPEPDDDEPFKVLGGEPNEFPDAPQTGDNSNVTLWALLLVLSAGALVVLFVKRKKNEE